MQITIDTNSLTPADFILVAALAEVLEKMKRGDGTADLNPVSEMPAPAAEADAGPVVVEEAPAKKRGRPRKEAAEGPAVDPRQQPIDLDPPAPAAELMPLETAPEPAGFTIDGVRVALQQFTAVKGVPAGVALLKEFGASRISELKAEQYDAFVAQCAV